jgi:hypothetical protein
MACGTSIQANPEEKLVGIENTRDASSVNSRENQMARAKQILNRTLFETIKQGSLKGVQFLVECGVDPNAENKHGRTPLDLAERLAEEFPDNPVLQEIVNFLSHYDLSGYEVDDRLMVATAREIWGLHGGDDVSNEFYEALKQYEAAGERVKAAKE